MAIIRNTASMRLRGRVGNTTYYVEGGRQIARVSQNASNYGETASRSKSQQFQRGKWGNLVNFYKASRAWMRKAYESKSAKQSDYNRFMQLNTPSARVYLTKDMYANGGCVVDAFRISEGSLRPINVTKDTNIYVTDLKLGNLVINPGTSVGEFTKALIDNNNHIRENMQISFISYQQNLNGGVTPAIICTAYEVTLQLGSSDSLRSYLPEFCSSVTGGYLSTNNNISTGAFAYVLSLTQSGKTAVSTQSLIVNNETLLREYTSEYAIKRSIDSYGVDADVFLMSGSDPMTATSQPVFIQGLRTKNGIVPQGGNAPTFADFALTENTANILISGVFTSVDSAEVLPRGQESWISAAGRGIAEGGVYISGFYGPGTDGYIQSVQIVLDGKTYYWNAKEAPEEVE